MQTDQINQMYKALLAMKEMLFEAHGGCSEATQAVEYQMSLLDEEMASVDITAEMIKELRVLTGEGMLSCNKALRSCKGNMEKAVDYLNRSGNISLTDSHWGN
jgi:hypothetical protein